MQPADAATARLRTRAGWVSLTVGGAVMAGKFSAWLWTGSTAVLSDALESIVNVIAAGFALYAISVAQAPPDREHPYGHGRMEDLSSAFEGGLIFVAGVFIIVECVDRLLHGVALSNLGPGMAVIAAAAAVNLALGLWLVRAGRLTRSAALQADGQHVLSDVWTSGLGLVALLAVKLTGHAWFDPLFALIAAANLLWMGGRLVGRAARGMMDEADPLDLQAIEGALAGVQHPLLLGWGAVRARHHGRLHHVDLTLYVPGEATVEEAHALADRVEVIIGAALGEAEVICHVEPRPTR